MFVLVSYDVVDDRRRNRIAKVLERFGDRVQMSVFECNVEIDEMERMRAALTKHINADKDSVRIYRLCLTCKSKIEIMGYGTVSEDPDVIVV